MAKSNFIVRGGADFSGIKKGLDQTQKQLTNFQNSVNKSMKVVGSILGSLAIGKLIKDSTAMAISVESAVGNINRNMGIASNAFSQWAETQSKAWGMARADAYKFGSIFSNLFASFTNNAEENAEKTEDILKAAAIIASKTGRSYEDTADRIRSGMLGSTEAIEDLGVYVNVAMIESTKAFRKFAGDKSWAQLDFRTQQQIRLAAILEQTYARYGDTLADNTQTRQAQFIASLKNIQLNIGQAFLPIYNAVLPPLTALANKLDEVTAKLKYFTQAIFGKAIVDSVAKTEEQTTALAEVGETAETVGDQTADASRKVKKALAGFDELNQLTNQSETSGKSAGPEAGMPGGETVEGNGENAAISSDFENAINAIKEALEKTRSYIDAYLKNPFKEAVDMAKPEVAEFVSILSGIWDDLGKLGVPLKNWFISDFTPFLQNVIKTMGTVISGLFDSFNKVFSDIWNIVVYPILENFISVALPTITDFADKAVSLFGVLFGEVKKIFDMIWSEAVAPALDILTKIWTDTVNVISDLWTQYGTPIFEGMKRLFKEVGDLLQTVWKSTLKPVWDTFMETVDWLWEKHLKPLLANFMGFVAELVACALQIINEFIIPLVKAFVETFGPAIAVVFETAISILGTFIGTVADVISGVITIIKGIIQYITGVFTGDWEKAWDGIVNIFKGIFEGIGGIVKGVINTVIDIINAMMKAVTVGINFVIDKINSLKIDIPDWVPEFGGKSFGLNIPKITAPQIPKLATGAVIPPNSPFLAVLGDQKSGTNIEAPLATIEQALRNVIAEQSRNTKSGNLFATFILEGREVGRIIAPYVTEEDNRLGVRLIDGVI